tara:strand:- start:433 stop:1593 length:1161 start_codon:yes stop_codon:yes gene_type:complete
MKTYTYHKELRVILAHVLNALGDLVIKRLNEADESEGTDTINVSLKYAPKQRILNDIVNKNQHIQLPVMALSMSNLSFDKERSFNKIEGFMVNTEVRPEGGSFPQPVPVNLDLNFSVLSRYQRDLDQIITCIFANFHPYIVISYAHPDLGHEVRCAIMWDGNIKFNYPNDIKDNMPYRITADSSFKVMGWIYKNASNPYGIIHNIDTSFTNASAIYADFDVMQSFESPTTTDYLTISGRPQVKAVDPYVISMGDTSVSFNLIGDMFNFVDTLAISAVPQSAFPLSSYELLNPFVSSENLSSEYPAFSAVPLLSSDWSITNDNRIQFFLPSSYDAGFVDVIAISPWGMGQLQIDSVRETYNPYVSGTSDHTNYQEFQFPYVSGVEIR